VFTIKKDKGISYVQFVHNVYTFRLFFVWCIWYIQGSCSYSLS